MLLMRNAALLSALAAAAALAGCAPPYARRLSAADEALRAGRYDRARELYGEAAALAQKDGLPPAERARARGGEAAAGSLMGRPGAAEKAYRAALDDLRAAPGAELARAALLADLAAACAVQGRGDEAAGLYRKSVEEYGRAPDAPPLEVAARLADLGQLELASRRYGEAEKAYAGALALRERAGARDAAALGPLLEDLAAALRGQGKQAEAEAVVRRARALGRP